MVTWLVAFRNNPWVWLISDLLVIVLIGWGAWNTSQIHSTQRRVAAVLVEERAADYANCMAANDSRTAVKNLLRAALTNAEYSSPGIGRRVAIDFYKEQIALIKFGDCSVYRD